MYSKFATPPWSNISAPSKTTTVTVTMEVSSFGGSLHHQRHIYDPTAFETSPWHRRRTGLCQGRASEACRDSDPRGAGQCKHRTATGRSHPPGTGHLKAGRFLDTVCSPTIGQQHRETQGRELAVKRFLVTCRHVPNWSYMTCMLMEGQYTQSDHPEIISHISMYYLDSVLDTAEKHHAKFGRGIWNTWARLQWISVEPNP